MHSGLAGILLRWLLPAFLAVALLGMHHLPAAAPAPQGPLPSVAAETSAPAALAPEPAHDGPGEHGAGHELLHLCLAVLTALAGLVLALFVVVRGVTGYAPNVVLPHAPLGWARPPPPLARRLAALGVLRL